MMRALKALTVLLTATALSLSLQQASMAQDMQSPRDAAPIDLEGYWTTLITEDWRWRMFTPPKGDFVSLPLNEEGRRVGNLWNPENEDGTCRPYGAGNLMRMPIRINITWEDDNTLRLESDHGMQTRYFHFNADEIQDAQPSWQGVSLAEWEGEALKVVTRNLRAGYIRRNGAPYSENAVVTEYFRRHTTYGEEWLTVMVIVDDPQYLTEPYFTSSSFKTMGADDEWTPTPCEDL